MNDAEAGLSELLFATARELHVEPPDLTSPFLDRLVSLSLEELVQQPIDIANELSAVQSELVNLCFREYSTFISVHKCSAAVQSAFDDFDTSLTRLIECGPDLETASRHFSKETSSIQESRSDINLVRDHQDKLLDLLGIPQLMDACVRNGFYQEAIELAAQMDILRGRYTGVPIVQAVVKESEQVLQAMLAQLLALLKEPVKLPSLMKAVGFLRRLGYLEEGDLALVFLASRSLFLESQFQQLERDKTDPVRYLRRYIDVFREHVYDIISQFSTIFDIPDLIVTFANQCVDALVSLVKSTVTVIGTDSASLSSILVQLAYCGTSFARVGFDFSPLIIQPFLLVVSSNFEQMLESATAELSTFLRNASRNASIPTTLLGSGVLMPSKISDFPPIALFANAHYTALNSLRLLAPTELLPRFFRSQTHNLAEATIAVSNYVLEVEKSWKDSDTPSSPSPRAHLLRRSTETMWTPAMRASRRKDSIKILLAFADVWRTQLLPSLSNGLANGIFGGQSPPSLRLDEAVRTLAEWCDRNREHSALDTSDSPLIGAANGTAEDPHSRVSSDSAAVNGFEMAQPPLPGKAQQPTLVAYTETNEGSSNPDVGPISGPSVPSASTSSSRLTSESLLEAGSNPDSSQMTIADEIRETVPDVPPQAPPNALGSTASSEDRGLDALTVANLPSESTLTLSPPKASSENTADSPSLADTRSGTPEEDVFEQDASTESKGNDVETERTAQVKKKKKRKGHK